MEDELFWTAGGDAKIIPVKRIGRGGYGDVFEVLSEIEIGLRCKIVAKNLQRYCKCPTVADSVKAFARKIVRQIGQLSKSDIENESRVVKLLMENGGHENIVAILGHGFLPKFDYFYVDMELCDLTLNDYIDYWAGNNESLVEAT